LPVFLVLFAGLCLWGFWLWLKKRRSSKRPAKKPIKKLPVPLKTNKPQKLIVPSKSDVSNDQRLLVLPDAQLHRWLEEIKRKLMNRNRNDDDNSKN
jgi:hypothetical protein